MGWFSPKKTIMVILLLVILFISTNFETCNARRGKHWRRVRGGYATSTLLANKKSKGINGWSNSYHNIRSKSRSWKKHSPSTSVTPPPPPPPPPPPTKAPSPKPCPPPTPTKAPSPKPSPPLPPTNKVPTPTSSPSQKPSPPLPPTNKVPTPTSSPSQKPSPPLPPTNKVPTPTSSPNQKPSPPHPSPKTSTSPPLLPPPGVHSKNLNVLEFGARGNGVLDDTKAFQAAWAAACKVEGSTIVVPSDHIFLVGPISFSGPYCQNNIVFQLDGTIIAPTSTAAWGSGTLQWLEFTKLQSITIRGKGVINGRGSGWWSSREFEFEPISNELVGAMPRIKPTALRFYGSYNVTVTGITIQNSPQCHLKFDNCVGVEVFNMTISSPADSLNTDGIHLQNSKDVSVHHNQLGCGDDCISIQTGCSNVNIHHVNCGPGHGISIGGLGKDNTKACVSNITIQNVQLQGTMTGVRIKTWQGGSGSVQNIRFSNIQVKEVQTPIVIDQFYCDRATCKNQSAAVSLSGISYENIKGTFTVKPVHLACSDSSPCSDITLNEIELQPLPQRYHMYDVFCWQTYGLLRSQIVPPIGCLQTGKPAKNLIQSDPDSC